ncbi:MAG: hypothetical protein GWN81_03825 [Phycisphaerae bacterium]|nr:hypothetical protein [Phycisphaerae bacterium]
MCEINQSGNYGRQSNFGSNDGKLSVYIGNQKYRQRYNCEINIGMTKRFMRYLDLPLI